MDHLHAELFLMNRAGARDVEAYGRQLAVTQVILSAFFHGSIRGSISRVFGTFVLNKSVWKPAGRITVAIAPDILKLHRNDPMSPLGRNARDITVVVFAQPWGQLP